MSENCWDLAIGPSGFISNQIPIVITSIISISLWVVFLVTRKKKLNWIIRKYDPSNAIIFFFMSLLLAHFFGAVRVYGEDVGYIFKTLIWFGSMLYYYHLVPYTEDTEFVQGIVASINTYSFMAVLLAIFVLISGNNIFLQRGLSEAKRFGLSRVLGFAENATTFSFFYYFFSEDRDRSIRNRLCLFVISCAIFFVFISRRVIISIIFACIIYMFSRSGSRKLVRTVLVFPLILLAFHSYFLEFLSSLNMINNSVDAYSMRVRLVGVNVFYEMFRASRGVGFGWQAIEKGGQNLLSQLNAQNVFTVDIGLFQALFQFGVLAILSIIYSLYLSKKAVERNESVLSLTMYYFFLSEIIGNSNIYYWPSHTFFYSLFFFLLKSQIDFPQKYIVISSQYIEPQ